MPANGQTRDALFPSDGGFKPAAGRRFFFLGIAGKGDLLQRRHILYNKRIMKRFRGKRMQAALDRMMLEKGGKHNADHLLFAGIALLWKEHPGRSTGAAAWVDPCAVRRL